MIVGNALWGPIHAPRFIGLPRRVIQARSRRIGRLMRQRYGSRMITARDIYFREFRVADGADTAAKMTFDDLDGDTFGDGTTTDSRRDAYLAMPGIVSAKVEKVSDWEANATVVYATPLRYLNVQFEVGKSVILRD
jgi:hypothetical protein